MFYLVKFKKVFENFSKTFFSGFFVAPIFRKSEKLFLYSKKMEQSVVSSTFFCGLVNIFELNFGFIEQLWFHFQMEQTKSHIFKKDQKNLTCEYVKNNKKNKKHLQEFQRHSSFALFSQKIFSKFFVFFPYSFQKFFSHEGMQKKIDFKTMKIENLAFFFQKKEEKSVFRKS